MANNAATKGKNYTDYLLRPSGQKWKSWLRTQQLYQWNIQRLKPGRTLDIGCGVGRYLENLPAGSIGTEHNLHSVKQARRKGLPVYLDDDFFKNRQFRKASFDSLLLSHVLEHLTFDDGLMLLKQYLPWLKPGGQLIICCPQQKGYASDTTHITFLDSEALMRMVELIGLEVTGIASFPFPKLAGKVFRYNEFVVVGRKQ